MQPAPLHLGIHNYLLLTSSRELCHELQTKHGVEGCAWSSFLESHGGLTPWGVKPGDMFLLWARPCTSPLLSSP